MTDSPTIVHRIQVFMDESLEYRWRAKAANGEIVAGPQESYTRREDAIRAARDVFPGVFIEPDDQG